MTGLRRTSKYLAPPAAERFKVIGVVLEDLSNKLHNSQETLVGFVWFRRSAGVSPRIREGSELRSRLTQLPRGRPADGFVWLRSSPGDVFEVGLIGTGD